MNNSLEIYILFRLDLNKSNMMDFQSFHALIIVSISN